MIEVTLAIIYTALVIANYFARLGIHDFIIIVGEILCVAVLWRIG